MRAALATAGYTVREAVDAHSGLAQMTADRADLILLDLSLADEDALDLVAKLRSVEAAADVPVLALAGFADKTEENCIGPAGFTDFLFKPVDIPLLLKTVQAHLGVARPHVPQSGGGRSILVINDEPNQLKLIALNLQQLGFEVITSRDSVEGLDHARNRRLAAIVANVLMPRLDGFQFCMRIRADQTLTNIPIILLSNNYVQEADQRLAQRVGASALIQRTANFQNTLSAVLKSLTSQPPIGIDNAASLREAHQERVARHFERQTGLNYELARRCATQSAQISVLAQMSENFLDGSISRATLHNKLLAQYIDAVGFSCGAILSFERERRLVTSAQIGFREPAANLLSGFFEPSGPLGEVIRGGEPLYIASRSSGAAPAREFLSAIGAETAFISPLRFGREELGIVLLASRTPVGDSEWITSARAVTQQIAQVMALSQSISRLQKMASFDTLTGLPNRAYLDWQLQKAVTEGRGIALYLLNLNRFQEINNTFGASNGNVLLRQVAARLRANAPAEAVVARLAGDEFALLRSDTMSAESVHRAASQTLGGLESTFKLSGLPIALRATMGIVVMARCDEDADTVLSFAATARRRARRAGKSYFINSEKPKSNFSDHLALLGDLREAIQRNELALHYQPKVTVKNGEKKSGQAIGVEALLRWRRPGIGWVAPDHFLPLAERAGLIYPITLWVVGSALRQASAWRRTGKRLGIAVNISPHDLRDPEFPDILANICKSTETENNELTLEFTERSLNDDPVRSRETLEQLSKLGFELSLDDFGTGHCSISDVQALPVTEIKIDKSFISNFVKDARSRAFVCSAIDLARHLGVQVVAEGIESRESYEALENLGCDLGQGFFIGRPRPPGEISL